MRGCQSGKLCAGQENVSGASTELQRKNKKKEYSENDIKRENKNEKANTRKNA